MYNLTKKTAKILSLALIGALSLTACTNNGGTETTVPETTAATTAQETTISQTTTTAVESTTAASSTTAVATTTAAPTTQPSDTNKPTDKVGIIALYNSAIQNTPNLKRVAFKRVLDLCEINAGFLTGNKGMSLLEDSNVLAVGNIEENDPIASNLAPITDADVKDATSTVEGNTTTLKILLNPKNNINNVTPGLSGYTSTVDVEQLAKLIEDTANSVAGDVIKAISVDRQTAQFELKDGIIELKIDNTSGKIISATMTGHEQALGKATVTTVAIIKINATATIGCTLSSSYEARS